MARFAKPFFVKARRVWRVQLDGRQINLGPDKAAAFRQYHELLSRPAIVESERVLGVIDGFLDWCKKHRSPRTYEWYTNHLQSFVNSLASPELLRVDDLKPFHVHDWVDARSTWGNSHRRGAIIAVQRAFSWAEKVGHILKSPLRNIEKPAAGRREQLISTREYEQLLANISDQPFRDVVNFFWETGARPQETRAIEAKHVNWTRSRVEIPPLEAKGKKRWRMIYLTENATQIVRRLADAHVAGPIFRNTAGRPWTAMAFNCRFGKLKKKLGVKYAAYSFRHTFANRLLRAGANSIVVGELLGHVDATMLAKVYGHLDQSADYLRDELQKSVGGS